MPTTRITKSEKHLKSLDYLIATLCLFIGCMTIGVILSIASYSLSI